MIEQPFSGKEAFTFELIAQEGNARAGIFHTPHGDIETPIFAPVGTKATVKGVTPAELEEIGASLILANTYHLFLRPGEDLVDEMGGLHKFMNWPHPILTDSGGFQVFSLSSMRKIDEDGVNFRSYIDGSLQRLTPERSIEIQEKLGADIIMAFDECAPPDDRKYTEIAMDRTHIWAEKCRMVKIRSNQALFGIVQGGIYPDLREKSASFITSLDFPGNAIGGLSVGESKNEMHKMIKIVNDILPKEKPRYLMGVGTPEDLLQGILEGVDIFDCVLPTRLARHNAAMTRTKRINLMNACYTEDESPIDAECGCYTCSHFSRAYIRHLIMAKEMLSATLISIHNIFTLVNLMKNARRAIVENRFNEFTEDYLNKQILDENY